MIEKERKLMKKRQDLDRIDKVLLGPNIGLFSFIFKQPFTWKCDI